MIKRFLSLVLFSGLGCIGYWSGLKEIAFTSKGLKEKELTSMSCSTMHPFVIVVYGRDDAMWCEKSLRSIFEQDYDAYRLIFIDDGSMDDTFERVHHFIEEARQEARTILIQNSFPMGLSASLKRASEQCFDKEIIFPICARDWLAHSNVFSFLNLGFQKKGTLALFMASIQYPDYSIRFEEDAVGYAPYFRDLDANQCYLKTLSKSKKQQKIAEPLVFHNRTLAKR